MKTHDFYYDLPPELIAQTPLLRRDESRLMTLERAGGTIGHHVFRELPDLLSPGDCLILNDSRVIPARLIGRRLPGGGVCEVLLLHQRDILSAEQTPQTDMEQSAQTDMEQMERTNMETSATGEQELIWECLVRPGRKMRMGTELSFGEGELSAQIVGELPGGNRLVRFDCKGIFMETLERLGQMPLPPYIREELHDPERYQTVYAKTPGSAAAPTAGLHFTPELLEQIRARGVEIGFVTLHVGLGTFRPVREEEITEHHMHAEYCVVPEKTAELVNRMRAKGGKCVCAGTTSCRTLEAHSDTEGILHAGADWTDIYIYPGYRFRVTDALITNFHLPESTLLMLVSAFAGREQVLAAYREAVQMKYRFFSFGDAMLLI